MSQVINLHWHYDFDYDLKLWLIVFDIEQMKCIGFVLQSASGWQRKLKYLIIQYDSVPIGCSLKCKEWTRMASVVALQWDKIKL